MREKFFTETQGAKPQRVPQRALRFESDVLLGKENESCQFTSAGGGCVEATTSL